MKDGAKKMSRFKTVVPIMVYVEPTARAKIQSFAKKEKTNVSQLAREAFKMRMSGDEDPYNNGFNQGLNEAMKIVSTTEGAKMMFPSGKSFAQLVCENIEEFMRRKSDENT
jgi:hypothetical protein